MHSIVECGTFAPIFHPVKCPTPKNCRRGHLTPGTNHSEQFAVSERHISTSDFYSVPWELTITSLGHLTPRSNNSITFSPNVNNLTLTPNPNLTTLSPNPNRGRQMSAMVYFLGGSRREANHRSRLSLSVRQHHSRWRVCCRDLSNDSMQQSRSVVGAASPVFCAPLLCLSSAD